MIIPFYDMLSLLKDNSLVSYAMQLCRHIQLLSVCLKSMTSFTQTFIRNLSLDILMFPPFNSNPETQINFVFCLFLFFYKFI